ncbi:hypothetical protein QOT17_010716 [Balamuthia mandrillaris]
MDAIAGMVGKQLVTNKFNSFTEDIFGKEESPSHENLGPTAEEISRAREEELKEKRKREAKNAKIREQNEKKRGTFCRCLYFLNTSSREEKEMLINHDFFLLFLLEAIRKKYGLSKDGAGSSSSSGSVSSSRAVVQSSDCLGCSLY